MDTPVVSVVIPALNAARTIAEQLEALESQVCTEPFEVIVADNGSSDNTRSIVSSYAARLANFKLVDASAKRSANAARNAGWRASAGYKLLFCDADDIAAPGWIAGMAAALDVYDGIGGMLDYQRLNPHLSEREPQCALFRERAVRVPIGACSGWRRTLLERIGGFDDSWVIGGDDIEVAIRAAIAGARMGVAPDAFMHKREREDKRALARQFYVYGKARARLIKTFPDLAARRSALSVSREWVWLTGQLLRGRTSHGVVRRAAHNLGRLVGSIEHRCWGL